MAVAAVYTGYSSIAATATLQVTAAVIVTAILTPLLTTWFARRVERRKTQAA
jgi:2-keto-3-deoxygluconate permease